MWTPAESPQATKNRIGRDAFARWMDRFYDLIESQAPDIAVLFGGKVSEQHRAYMTDWWAEVMGGQRFTPRRAEATSTCSPATAIL
jgi:truncated hemoglobin YjbI